MQVHETASDTPLSRERGSQTSPPPGTRGGALGGLVALAMVLAIGVPVGLKIKAALEARKAMDVERAKTAQEAQAEATGPRSLALVRPTRQAWTPTVPFDGTLMAVQEVDLAFRLPGTIAKVTAKIGDRVEKGAPLAALDTSDLQASQRVAEASVKSATVQLSVAHENDALSDALIEKGAAPGVGAVQAKGSVGLASASLEAARAQVAAIGVSMRNSTIYAPFAGTITSAPTAAGGAASPGMPLFHLVDVSSLRLVGTVSELDAELVKVDAPVSLEGKPIAGAKVRIVLPTLDPATRRVQVEAIVPNDGASPMLAGSFVRASIAGSSKVDVLALPATALRPGSQDEVFVVAKGKASIKRVTFTRGPNGELYVRAGLDGGDVVVEAPPTDLPEGAPIDAKEPAR